MYACMFQHISGTPGTILTKLYIHMAYYLDKILWGYKTPSIPSSDVVKGRDYL